MNVLEGKATISDELSLKLETAWAEAFCALVRPGGHVQVLLNRHSLDGTQQRTAKHGSFFGRKDVDAALLLSDADLLSDGGGALEAALETVKADGFVLFRTVTRAELQGEKRRTSPDDRARQVVEVQLGARLVGRELVSTDVKKSRAGIMTYVGLIYREVEQSGQLRSLFARVAGYGGVPETDAERVARLLFAISYCAFDGLGQIEQVGHLIPPDIQPTVSASIARLWMRDRTRLERSLEREAAAISAYELAQQRIERLESDLDAVLTDQRSNALNLIQSLEAAESQVRALKAAGELLASGGSPSPNGAMEIAEEAKQ